MVLTRADVIKRLAGSERALLLREISPLKTQEGLAQTLSVLRELKQHYLVTMNPQTDRWRYCGPEIRP